MKTSLNNRFVLEKYTKRVIEGKVQNGFAMMSQKVSLVPLRLLTDAVIATGATSILYPKGSLAYIQESILHTHPQVQKVFSVDSIEEPFIVLDSTLVDFVERVSG